MRIFLTGASGFLGRHLQAHLKTQGHEITLVDSKTAPLLDLQFLTPFNKMKFDRIYHLAAYTRAGDFCSLYGGDQWIINQQLNTNILNWWHKHQPQARLLAFGTSVSYAKGYELTEENYLKDEPIERFYSYAMTKRMLLVGMRELAKQYELQYSYAVPSTVYGANYHLDGRDMHFIYDIIFKIIRGKKNNQTVTLWGDGLQKRELIHISDFIRGLDAIMDGPKNEIYNLGSGEEFSIREFAQIICEELSFDYSKVKFDEARYAGLRSKILNIEKLKSSLNYQLLTTLKIGLRETIKWCESVEGQVK